MPLDYNDFAEQIKQKYPEYKDVDNYKLATAMIEKYPEYKTQVNLKKKEVSQSTLGQSNTSSGRLSNTTTKPTASSSSPEILTDYLGKSKKKYKFEDNQWYEENPNAQVAKSTPSKFGGTAKTYGQELKYNPNAAQGSWKPIEDETRIKSLNYYYKKDGSLATEEKVFTNYDAQKKDNLYRINNGQWERKVPKGYFAPVNDETATKALNKRYGQNVVFTPTVAPVVKKEDPKFTDINSNLTAKTEENAISYLEKNYGNYGFEFNQEGLFLVDQIRVKTKDGKKEEVFEFDEKNPEEAARLRAFLEENKSKAYSQTYNYLDEKVRSQSTGIPRGEGRTPQEIQDYLKAAQIKKGLYILSDDYLNNFKKLDADEMKDQITNVIGKSGLDAQTIQDFYKTDAYKAYKTKKADLNKAEQERLNGYYDELKYAKVAGDKAKVKEAQNKIDAYLTNDVIADNVKNYDMQLNDLKNRNKQLETEYADYEKQVNKFNSEKAIIDQKVKSGEISREQYNGMVDGLNNRADQLNDLSENIQTKAQKIKLETDNVSTSQKKLNYVAGKYVAAKEKEGGAIGFAVNSILNGVSGAFIEPFANYAALGNQYEDLSPEEKQYYKDKKYTKDQVENILDNKAILKAKNQAKEMLVSSVGFEETTQEYMKSGDRGFIATALGGVLQSLPAMATGVLGKAASFTSLAAQAYSGIEEEMLTDPDFQTTSVGERSIIAIPYAIGMGILENAGLTNMIKSNSVTGRALQGLVAKVIEKAPKGATQDIINKLVTKEIESNLAKGVIKITQAGLAEFETGATQSLVLDQGLKQLYNIYAQRKMSADEKKNLSKGEFFDTADSFGELATQTFEDGLAEAIGGVTLGAVGTLSQRILKGNVSIYNADDVEFLKNVAGDDNFKKLFVANLKTSMLNGSMTKGQAQDQLDALNEIQGVFTKLPEGISKDQMKQAMDLVVEKTKLDKEIAGKDPALVAAQTERINAINEELKTISQNAVQKQTTSEVSVQPGAKVGGEVAKGESQAGSQVIAEEVSKAKEEVDQYIADAGSEARIGSAINPLVEKMAAAENIDDADIDSAIETIFNEVDSLEKSDQYSPETKKAISEKLLNIADKLDNYEFRTTTETVATTKAGAATTTRKTSEAVQKINAERYFNGVTANVNGQEVTFTDNKGRVEATMPNGEVVVLDTPTISVVEDGFEFDENGALEAVTVTDRLGNNVRFTGDIALDLAIRDRENKLGVVEQAEFETAYQEVKKNYIKEAPAAPAAPAVETTSPQVEATAEVDQVETYRAEEQAELLEAIPNIEDYKKNGEVDKTSMPDDVLAKYNEIYNKYDKLISPLLETTAKPAPVSKMETTENELTERNARTMSVKYKRNPIVRAAINVLKALPGIKIYLHENADQYSSALANKTGESKQSIEKSAGSYIDGEIHLDMSKADLVTLLHEAFHHAIEVNGIRGKYIIDMAKGLRDIIKDKDRLAELDAFIEQYEEETDQETLETRADEFVAQLGGILAANQEELTTTGLKKFMALINRIFKKLGLGNVFTKASTSQDAVNFINAITRGFNVGEDVSGSYDPNTGKLKFQADFSDPLSKLTFVYDKNKDDFKKLEKDGYITYDNTIADFAGKYMFLHQPDAAFSGMIYKNGELLVEGKGGVYYPIKFHKDGYFWASTSNTAKKMAEDLNKVLEQNGGTIYMALTSAPSDKLMSSTTMSNAILDFFSSKAFDKNFKISQAQLKQALITAANDTKQKRTVNKETGKASIKNVGLNLGIKPSASISTIQSLIKSKLNPDNSSFGDRKNFAEELIKLMSDDIKNNPDAVNQFGKLFSEGIQNKYFKGVTKTGKLSISKANMVQAISEMFTEPLLKEGVNRESGGQVYAVIELNGPVKPVDSDKHESYPKAIQSDSDAKVIMHILQDRRRWSDVFEDFENDSDITKERETKIFPTSGVSVRGLRVKSSVITAPTKTTPASKRKKQLIERTDKASEKLQQLFQRDDMPLTIEEAKEIVGEVIDWTTWYDGLSTYVDGIFGEYAEDVLSLLPLASMAANSTTTVSLAISNAERVYQGEMPKGVAEYYGYISDFLQGKGIKSDKMSNFFKALTGDKDAIAVDSHVWSIIMWKNPNKKQVNPKNQAEFDKAKEFIRVIADGLGLAPREVQAALWAANILRTGARPDSYEEYFKKQLDAKGLKQRIETWRDKGYKPFSEVRKEREAAQKTGRKKQLVYHGGDVINESDLIEGDPLYVSQDKKQAELYAKEHNGSVAEFDIDETKIADEELAYELIDKLGLKAGEGWVPKELSLYELIDPMFEETAMSQSDINKLFEEITKRGYDGIKFTDSNLDTYKQDIENYVIIDPKKTIFSKSKIKFQKAPKILGQKPTVVIVNDEAKALIDQIKLEVRAQREQKKAHTEVRKSISDSVKALVKKGSINLKQASTVISTLNRVNFDNPEMVKRFNDYIAKVFDKAEYIDKVERATRMKKKIKANLKGSSNPFAIAAKGFSQLEPKWVENIDDYIMIAQAVYDSVKKSAVRKGVINWKQEADFQIVAEYVFDEEARQTEMLLGNLRSLYERITGESSNGVAADVMQAELKDLKVPEDFSADVLDQIEEKLAEFEQMVEDTDPEVVKKAASIDPTIIPTKEAIRILDALDTYFMNGSTAGLDDLMNLYIGRENVIKFKYKGKPLRSFGSKLLAQTKFKQLTQFNMILERKFRTKEAALAYKKASGIQGIENGANKAEAQAMRKQREYMTKFGKIKGFNSAENIFQRGALANLLRTMVASEEMQQAEFDRNITILRNSVDTLSKGNANDQKKAKVYKKVLTDLGVFRDDVDIEMVLNKAKKENIAAVNFVIDMFGEIVDPLSDLALGMYNQILTQDVNYTPYVYKMTDLKKTFGSNQDNSTMDFFGVSNYANQTFDKNKAGVLMPITRPKTLQKGMHIDLDFDNNMFRQYRNALVDLYTAGPIRQFEGFFNSEENEKILGSNEDQEIIKSAMIDYVRTKKGSNFITDDGLGFLNKISDYMAQFGAARALVGIGQFVNQFSSGMTNTIVNAGEYIRPGDFSKEMFDFIANSGRSIANVGGDEILIAMGDIDKSIERADLGNRPDQYVLKFIAKENMRLFNIMVAYPDAIARKLAWMAYYRKSMVEQGLLGFTESVDTTKLNDTAADYAQLMVDRNMDATDATLRGSLFRNRNASVKILRSIFMPFASFGINQKNRMWNDLNSLASGKDKVTSARSIVSIAGELVVYNAIRYYIAKTILGAALSLLGYDDDDQEELYNKLLNNAKLSSFSKLFTDIISPLPLLDNQTLNLANKAMKGSSLFAADPEAVQKYVDKLKQKGNLTDEEIEEKKKAFEEKNARSFYVDTEANIGTLGIQYEKAIELMDLVNAWRTGEFVDDNKNERFLSKESREKLTAPLMMKFVATVYGTRELDQIANKSFKLVKDAESMSKTQQENFDEVKKELDRDLTELERSIIKKKRTVETAIDEINFIKKNGGLNKEQGSEYLKLLDVIPKPSPKMIIDIQNGQKAADIIKRSTE